MEDFEDQKFIPGIYNWCDRWCERCAMTDRCRLFEREESRKQAHPEQDWTEAVADNFAETLQMLQQMADEMGIDLESEEVKEEAKAQMALIDAQEVIAENHPLHELSEEYWKKGKAWLDSTVLKDHLLQWKDWVEMGTLEVKVAESNLKSAEEALDVIQWFLFMIPVKIKRALHDQLDGFWEEYEEHERGDLGTAKIAAISIERSTSAWKTLHELLPQEEELIDILSILEKMQKGLLEVFPNYSKFIRPGFDD
jgi:hypothetical protein